MKNPFSGAFLEAPRAPSRPFSASHRSKREEGEQERGEATRDAYREP